MHFARLFRVLLAAAVMIAASLTSSAAFAMVVPAPEFAHHGAAMDSGHCAQMPAGESGAPNHGQDQPGKSCCAATCLGTATFATFALPAITAIGTVPQLAAVKTFHGLIAEIATPPPRRA